VSGLPQLENAVDGARLSQTRHGTGGARPSRASHVVGRQFDPLCASAAARRGRFESVARPGLVNRLRAARDTPLVTVVAPAGFGKTTLLWQWAARDERRFAWVTVEDGDDAAAVTRCLTTALGGLSDDAADARAGHSGAAQIRRLSSLFARSPEPIVLVLEDLHVACATETTAVVAELARHVPEGSTLALVGRSLPALPIARFRAEGRLFELGADELALSRREAELLLRAIVPDIDPADALELRERTEGWAAGLHLAGLFLGDGAGRRRPVVEFTGDDRFVSDYFRHEHLARLDPAEVRFLTRSSILESMSGPLCGAVVGETRDGVSWLDALERSSSFVVPLDRRRGWYRYQRLFRETLRAELERGEPELVPVLNRRASAWCEANGMPDAARRYAAAAGDLDMVARVVAAHALTVHAGEQTAHVDWLDGVGRPALLERHPKTAVVGSWLYALDGRTHDAALWLAAAEQAPTNGTGSGTEPIAPLVALLRAAFCRDGVDAMAADAELAAGALAWASPWRPAAVLLSGVARLLQGDDSGAEMLFADAADLAAATGRDDVRRLALAERLLLAAERRDASLSRDLAEGLRAGAADRRGGHGPSALALAALARFELRRGNWNDARAALADAAAFLPRLTQALPWCSVQALLELARAHMALLETETAASLTRRVEAVLERRPALGALASDVAAQRAELTALRERSARRESNLTPAELRLLPLLSTRLSFREIGERLHVSRNTVKTQAIAVYRKLGVSSRNDAIDRATELGLLDATTEG
jgi:LuxR family maltose regulon positive regulatory protein